MELVYIIVVVVFKRLPVVSPVGSSGQNTILNFKIKLQKWLFEAKNISKRSALTKGHLDWNYEVAYFKKSLPKPLMGHIWLEIN